MNEREAPPKKTFSFLEDRVARKHVPNANVEEEKEKEVDEKDDVADANNKKKPTASVWFFLWAGILASSDSSGLAGKANGF